ncbi:YdcH family protein [Nitrospina sp. 32_T5]|uniref:YdcH family protein n=1 Tax=unclassified Nitrospina TaxID=2638683 RepID=UPI003F98FEE4
MDIDPEVLEKAKSEIPEFERLFDEHTRLKHQVEELNKRPYLTPEEELEKKNFQKQKLICKDKLESMLETLEPEAS